MYFIKATLIEKKNIHKIMYAIPKNSLFLLWQKVAIQEKKKKRQRVQLQKNLDQKNSTKF